MWDWERWKGYGKPGGPAAVVAGFIAAVIVAYFFDLRGSAFWLSFAICYLVLGVLQWTVTITNGLWRIEEKLDDIESRLDAIELNTDSPDDRPDKPNF